jgi:UDP-GlcNAc:undecaprenyl-phosphate/decaprenyl-phosphate GlcNAc-1-phosphate transferase
MMAIWLAFILAFFLSLLLVPILRWYGQRHGRLALPRADRWHDKPMPTMGGVGIFLAFATSTFISVFLIYTRSFSGATRITFNQLPDYPWGFLVGSVILFGIGLLDDLKRLPAPVKLLGQILAAAIVVWLGFSTNFFTPWLQDAAIAAFLNRLLTLLWLVGITNAINLIDNIDGLAGGISLITALFLAFLFWRAGSTSMLLLTLALAGSVSGFLIYNYPPASIFMGDSGSMFLGFTLASLAIARQPQASNVFAILGAPTLLFLLPILDTALVIITRMRRGESPLRGGRDHTSHRLFAFGFSERRVIWILYLGATVSGIAAITIEAAGYWLSLILVPIVVLGLTLGVAYLAGVKPIASEPVDSTLVEDLTDSEEV